MNDASSKAAARPPALPDHDALVERWWADHFPGSPVAATTAAWNHAFAAKEDLKRRLINAFGATPQKQEN